MTRQHQSALSRLGFRDPDKENPRHGLACEYLQEKMRPYAIESLAKQFQRKALEVVQTSDWVANPSYPFHRSDFIGSDLPSQHWYATATPSGAIGRRVCEYIDRSIHDWASQQIEEAAELSSLITGPSSGAKGFLDVSFRAKYQHWYLTPAYITCQFKRDGEEEPEEMTIKWGDRPMMPSLYKSMRSNKVSGLDNQFAFWGEVRIEPTAPELLLQQIEFYASNLPKSDMIWVLADFDLADFKRMAQQQFPQLKCFQLGAKFEEWCQNRERPDIPEL